MENVPNLLMCNTSESLGGNQKELNNLRGNGDDAKGVHRGSPRVDPFPTASYVVSASKWPKRAAIFHSLQRLRGADSSGCTGCRFPQPGLSSPAMAKRVIVAKSKASRFGLAFSYPIDFKDWCGGGDLNPYALRR